MMKRKFKVHVECNMSSLGYAIVELDQKVIDAVDDDWRHYFYNLVTPEEIAEHIAYNLIVNEVRLTQLDGWANLSDDMARIIKRPERPDWEFEAEEILDGSDDGNH